MQTRYCEWLHCGKAFQVNDDVHSPEANKLYCSNRCKKHSANNRVRERLRSVVNVETENTKLKERARDLLRDLLMLLDANAQGGLERHRIVSAMRIKYEGALRLREQRRASTTGRTAQQQQATVDADSTPPIIVDEVGD